MSEIVKTTGRPMSRALQDAIDELPNREILIRVLDQIAEGDARLGKVYAALALELRLAQLRDQDTFRRLEIERLDEIPEPPLPEATGRAMIFDPETGEFTTE